MSELNARGHLLSVSDPRDIDALWDLCRDLSQRYSDERGEDGARLGPLIHGFPPALVQEVIADGGPDAPRWCVHPVRTLGVECQADRLSDALIRACDWLIGELPSDLVWDRG